MALEECNIFACYIVNGPFWLDLIKRAEERSLPKDCIAEWLFLSSMACGTSISLQGKPAQAGVRQGCAEWA